MGLQLPILGLLGQRLDIIADTQHALGVCILDDGRKQAIRGLHGHRNVHIVVLTDELRVPRSVHTRHLLECECGCLDYKVVHANLSSSVLVGSVELLPYTQHLIHRDLHAEVVMRHGVLSLEQTPGGHAADVGVGNIGEGGPWGRGRGSRCCLGRSCRSRGSGLGSSLAGSHRLVHILCHDPALWSTACQALQAQACLRSQLARVRAGHDTLACARRRGWCCWGLRGGGGLRGWRLLSGSSSRGSTLSLCHCILCSEILEGLHSGLVLNHNHGGSVDGDVLGPCRQQNLSQVALLR
mmetsp:Transcript_8168/g.21770  ORF Transcript_8168/g.21770 Transcript_8168/m.21770 type:complete len:296 (+) Transcript_8168:888-1775(+)